MIKVLSSVVVLLALSACGTEKAPTFGEMLMGQGKEEQNIGDQWADGNELVEDGAKLIEDGKEDIEDAEKLLHKGEKLLDKGKSKVRKGESKVTKGTRMMNEAEAAYKVHKATSGL